MDMTGGYWVLRRNNDAARGTASAVALSSYRPFNDGKWASLSKATSNLKTGCMIRDKWKELGRAGTMLTSKVQERSNVRDMTGANCGGSFHP